jgi:hypothetical protein
MVIQTFKACPKEPLQTHCNGATFQTTVLCPTCAKPGRTSISNEVGACTLTMALTLFLCTG